MRPLDNDYNVSDPPVRYTYVRILLRFRNALSNSGSPMVLRSLAALQAKLDRSARYVHIVFSARVKTGEDPDDSS